MTRQDSVRSVAAQRRFFCDRCQVPVVVCTSCDRGQRYCGRACAQAVRRENQRASNRRYQATERGRKLHSARQARYRDRLRQSGPRAQVTEQGCRERVLEPFERGRRLPGQSCLVCSAPRTEFLRLGPKVRSTKRVRRSRQRTSSLSPAVIDLTTRASDRQNPALPDRR